MKKVFKALSLLLIMAVLSTGVAGCKGKTDGSGQGSTVTGNGKDFGKTTIVVADWMGNYDRAEENEMVKQAIEKKFQDDTKNKIDLNVLSYPGNAYADKINVMLGGGDDLDAFIMFNFINYASKPGLVKPLDDVLNTSGKGLKEKIPQANWDAVTYDNKICAIPNVVYGQTSCPYIRKDLLDKAGLGVPQTLEELEKAFEAFKGMDITPFCAPIFRIDSWLLGCFNMPAFDFTDTDGKVKDVFFHPNYKLYLETLHKWYVNGYMPKDFIGIQWQDAEKMFYTGKQAMMVVNYFNPPYALKKIRQVDENAKLINVPVIKTSVGDGGIPQGSVTSDEMFILNSSKKADGIVTFWNWLLSDQVNYTMASMGVDGVHYKLDMANKSYEKLGQYADPATKGYGGTFALNLNYNFFSVLSDKTADADTKEGNELAYSTRAYMDAQKPIISPSTVKPVKIPDEISKKLDAYKTERDNTIAKLIIGTIPLSEYDNLKQSLWEKYVPVSEIYTQQVNK